MGVLQQGIKITGWIKMRQVMFAFLVAGSVLLPQAKAQMWNPHSRTGVQEVPLSAKCSTSASQTIIGAITMKCGDIEMIPHRIFNGVVHAPNLAGRGYAQWIVLEKGVRKGFYVPIYRVLFQLL